MSKNSTDLDTRLNEVSVSRPRTDRSQRAARSTNDDATGSRRTRMELLFVGMAFERELDETVEELRVRETAGAYALNRTIDVLDGPLNHMI